MEFIGIITKIGEVQNRTSRQGKAWQTVEIMITENKEQYPESICVTAINERISELADFKVGTPVRCLFNARAHEYKGRYFNNLTLYKIMLPEQPMSIPKPTAAPQQPWSPQQPQPQQAPIWQQTDQQAPF